MNNKIRLRYLGRTFDINVPENTNVPLSKKITDVSDITKRRGNFSKSIILYGDKVTNQIFSHIYSIDALNLNFDRTKKIECTYFQGDVHLISGTLRLLNVDMETITHNNTEQAIKYEVIIYDDTSEFFSLLKENLEDNDYSDLNHTWDWDTILAFQQIQGSDVQYFFPAPFTFESNTRTFYDSTTNSNLPYTMVYTIEQMYPSLNAWTYLRKIFDKYQYQFEFEEADSYNIALKDLYIPFNRAKLPDNINQLTHQTPFLNTDNSNGIFGGVAREKVIPIVEYGSIINMGLFIPRMTEREFIQSIFTMFNLYVTVDIDEPRRLIIKTRDKFYSEGKSLDWTSKLDNSKEKNISFVSDEYGVLDTKFKYKDGKNSRTQIFKDTFITTFGEGVFRIENEHLKGEKVNEISFNPYIPFQYEFTNSNEIFYTLTESRGFFLQANFANATIDGSGSSSGERENNDDNYIVNTALATFTGRVILTAFNLSKWVNSSNQIVSIPGGKNDAQGGDFDLQELLGKTIPQVKVVDELIYRRPITFYNYNDNAPSNLDMCFFTQPFYANIFNLVANSNLLNAFYSNSLLQLQNGKYYEAYFNLDENDFYNTKLNDKIIVNGVEYFLFEISDYNANGKQSTKVKLVTSDNFNKNFVSEDETEILNGRYLLNLKNPNSTTGGQFLENVTPIVMSERQTPFSMFIRLRSYSTRGQAVVFDSTDGTTGRRGIKISVTPESGDVRIEIIGQSGSPSSAINGLFRGNLNRVDDIIQISYDGTSSSNGLKCYINNIDAPRILGSFNTLIDSIVPTDNKIYIGRPKANPGVTVGFYFDGAIQEISMMAGLKPIGLIQEDFLLGTQVLMPGFSWVFNRIIPTYNDNIVNLGIDTFITNTIEMEIQGKALPLDLTNDFILL